MPELTAGGKSQPTGRATGYVKNKKMPELTPGGRGGPTGRGHWLYKKCLNLQ